MTQKAAKQFSPGLRERAVRMVQDREREGDSQWESVGAIAARIGCSRETLRRWVRQGEGGCRRNAQRLRLGERPGLTVAACPHRRPCSPSSRILSHAA